MKILSIETSCDETAVSILEANGGLSDLSFNVLSNLVLSQIKLHEKYGGVFPSLAKREHAKNLAPLLREALEQSGLLTSNSGVNSNENEFEKEIDQSTKRKIKAELSRETELFETIIKFLEQTNKPKIDLIAVTYGPGLEPALWVGINAAKVLSEVWGIPIIPINHMEGHISSVLLDSKSQVEFPVLALLISGGHTELVLVSDWLTYKVIGQTRDDAVGEAYDKVARMLGLPYPGGPKIALLAEEAREAKKVRENGFNFPRPMIRSGDLDFSFSGLKTSVLYALRKISDLNFETKKEVALAFEDAVVETLVAKTTSAINEYTPKTLIVAGGVIANKTIRTAFEKLIIKFPEIKLLIPTHNLSTDNALMIALAAYVRYLKNPPEFTAGADNEKIRNDIRAQGNIRL